MVTNTRAALVLLSIFIIIALGACGTGRHDADLSAVIAEGILAPAGFEVSIDDVQPELITVTRGDFVRDIELTVNFGVHFLVTHPLTFGYPGGWHWNQLAVENTVVEAGELLAVQNFYISEYMEIQRRRFAFRIEQFEAGYTAGRAERLQAIRETRNAMNAASGDEREALRLQLRRQEIQLQQFTQNAQDTRENYHEQLERMHRYAQRIYAPLGGMITFARAPRHDVNVTPGLTVFTLAEMDSLVFHIPTHVDILRHSNIVTIRAGDAHAEEPEPVISFEAVVLADHLVMGRVPTTIFALQPLDIQALFATLESYEMTVFDFLNMRPAVEVNEVLIRDALRLPERAIRLEDLAEYVLIYEEGRIMKRFISTGLRFNSYVQVFMGVEEGQLVIAP